MSRPSDPNTVTIPTWATPTNYGPGPMPWNSHAMKVAPGTRYYTPNVPVSAEERNYLEAEQYTAISNLRDNLQNLYGYLGQIQAVNWPTYTSGPVDGSGGGVINNGAAVWNDKDGKWFVGVSLGRIFSSSDGRTWTQVHSLGTTHDTTGIFLAANGDMYTHHESGANSTYIEQKVSGTWGTYPLSPLSGLIQVTGIVQGYWIWAGVEATSGAIAKIVLRSSNDSGSSWAAPVYSGITTTSQGLVGVATKSQDRMVIIERVKVGGTAHSYSYVTTDGHTWSVQTFDPVDGQTAGTRICTAVSWDDINGKFIAVVCAAAANVPNGTTYFYTSPDGVVWTLAPYTVTAESVIDLQCKGTLWIATTYSQKVIYTTNPTSSGWFRAHHLDITARTSAWNPSQKYNCGPWIFQGDGQFFCIGENSSHISMACDNGAQV